MENSAGIGLVKRKLANSSYPTVEFTKDENDNFIFKSHTIIKTSETRFRLGEEFDEDRLDGKRVKSMVVADGVGLVKRKLANTTYPTLDITKDESDYISIKTTAPFRTQTTRFKVGEEFDEERMDGKVVKSLVTAQDNVYTQIQRDADLEIKYVREFTGDQIKVTSTANGISCYRVYKRIQ
ncbi:Lipocalin / cytosolic fatty-acid binding protein [Blomia tropicalis]|nr:Lipocalin / cytosolic fatty-acid binding protein [Blomia tropicalis]